VISISRTGLPLSILLLVSCSMPQFEQTPTAARRPTASVLEPESTAQPELIVGTLELIPAMDPGEWVVIGTVENRGGISLREISLRIVLVDGSGDPVASASVSPTLSNVAPDEVSPFAAHFRDAPTATAVSILVEDYEPGNDRRGSLQIELQEQFITESGEFAVIGTVANLEAQFIGLSGIGLLAEDAGGRPRSLAEMVFGPGTLGAGEEAVFLALAAIDPAGARWRIFHDGSLEAPTGDSGLIFEEDPVLHLTPQGAPFVVGSVGNGAAKPLTGSILFSLRSADRVISVSELTLPITLAPNTRLAFAAVDFPGFSFRGGGQDPASLVVDARLEGSADGAEPSMLAVEVDSFHSVGSVLLIGGQVLNQLDQGVRAPVVLAEVRSTTGELLTAGWSELSDQLDVQQRMDFVLELPLVSDLDLPSSEVDLRAIGTTAPP
jgi:hypothetical protein